MSILEPLEASGSSNSEGCLYVGRSNIVGATTMVNSSNLMRLYCKPDISGTASHPCAQVGSPTSEIGTQSLDLLSKRSLSEIERQAIFRAVRQRKLNLPILPLSSMDFVAFSESSDSLTQNARSYPYHRQQLSISPSHSQGSVYSPPLSSISDSNVDEFHSLPFLQSAAALENLNLPILPLSSMDFVAFSESSDSLTQNARPYPYHRQQLSISPSHSQGSVYSPPLSIISDSNVDEFHSLPFLQSAAALEKPTSYENFSQSRTFSLPKLKSSDSQRATLGGSARMVEEHEGIRQKLQELERELLSDNDDSILANTISPEQNNHLDQEWVDTIQNLLSEDAVLPPSTVSAESQSHPCSNNESPTSQTSRPQHENQKQSFPMQIEQKTLAVKVHIDAWSSCKNLLVDCAAAISEGKTDQALLIVRKLMQKVSVYGDPMQRLTAYMVESLVTCLGPLAQGFYNAIKWKEMPSRDHFSAAQLLFEVCPYIKFGYMAANSTILEAFKTEKKVHIIDFEIRQGSQYITLIHALAARTGGPPEVRMTVVDDPESTTHAVGDLCMVGEKLVKLAKAVCVHLRFHTISEKIADVQPWMLDCRSGEALAVNFAFKLHLVPDESVSTKNPRDQLLRMVKGLNPKVVTIVENEMNTNTAPFLARFMEALRYYSAVFESLDIHLPRESRDRINIEKQCLARDIVNIVACEGAERTERFEVAGKWRSRMTMAGFTLLPFSSNVNESIRPLYESCSSSYRLKEEKGALHFGWQDKALIVASAWY